MTKRVLVSGASTGIGDATVRMAREHGWEVVATARREDRLEKLAAETGCDYMAADLTVDDDVDRLVAYAKKLGVHALVNNAGGALGTDSVLEGSIDDWRTMYERNVLGTLRLSQGIIPIFQEQGGGDIVTLTSTAAHDTYPGGAGYVAAKHAERIIPNTLRLELVGQPIRVIEIAPGMVHTSEFSLNRFKGDQAKADKVYEGVENPLVAADIAEAIMWTLELPSHVNVDSMILRPVAQASNTVVARG